MYDKIHLKCYVIVLHFLSFPFLFFFFFFFFIFLLYFINTQNCPLKNVSFGYTLYRTVDWNFANFILNIVERKGIILKNTFKNYTAIKKAVTKCTKEVTNKPLTFSFLLRGDNRKYNWHSRVLFSNFGVLKNSTPESPLSSITRIGTWTLWSSSLINLSKIILISTEKDVFISKNRFRFSTEGNSTDVIKTSKEELETGNGERMYSGNLHQNLIISPGSTPQCPISIASAIYIRKTLN